MPAHRETLLEAAAIAEQLDDCDRLARAALANTRGTITMDVDLDRVRVLEAALARVDRNTATGARLLVAIANESDPDDWERARGLALEAVSIARESGDEATLLTVLNGTGMTLGQPDWLDQRMAHTQEAIELADRLGDRAAAFQARYERRSVLMEALRFDEADALLEDLVRLADETRLPFLRWQCEIVVVGRETELGHLDTAEALAEATMALGTRTGVVETLAAYGGQLHDIRMMQGRRQEIASLFIEATITNPTIPSLRNAAIGLCFEIGDLDEARRRYDDEVARGFSYPMTAQWLGSMEGAVDGNLVIDDRAGAAILYEQLVPYADRGCTRSRLRHGPWPARSAASRRVSAGSTRRRSTSRRRSSTWSGSVPCTGSLARCWTTPISVSRAARRATTSGRGTLRRRAREIARSSVGAGLEARADAMLGGA